MKILLLYLRMKKIAVFRYFFLRDGKILGREHFILDDTGSEEPGEVISNFMKSFMVELLLFLSKFMFLTLMTARCWKNIFYEKRV